MQKNKYIRLNRAAFSYKSITIYLFTTLLAIIFFPIGCNTNKDSEIKEKLTIYCGSCHLVPDPGLLTKEIWKNEVLPKMGVRLGIQTTFSEMRYAKVLAKEGLLPKEQLIPYDDWMEVISYYIENAPDSLAEVNTIASELKLFKPRSLGVPSSFTSASMVHYSNQKQSIIGCDGISFECYEINEQGKVKKVKKYSGAPSHYSNGKLLTMGKMPPHDNPSGYLYDFEEGLPIIDSLKRSVHFSMADFNEDGIDDYAISSFGNLKGDFSIYLSQENDYKKQVLINRPGAIRSMIEDIDGDGLKDIIVLMAQGREGLYWFKNEGGNYSDQRIIMEFQSSNGSAFFDMADMNNDGKLDILYVNGDNGDYKPIAKPYHGIHILMNESINSEINYVERDFLPYYGCYKAIPADYDKDGDIDLAAISYFPLYKNKNDGFRYYENDEAEGFELQTLKGSDRGKWLVMDAADIDGDDDIDLILGHSNMMTADVPLEMLEDWEQNQAVLMILENQLNAKELE